jgi:hypothetical protein
MRDNLAVVGAIVLLVVSVVALTFGVSALGLVHLSFFGPKYQEAERKIYEETPSYVQGKEQTLAELRLEYRKAKTAGERSNIKSMIINEAATMDLDQLKDSSLRRFVRTLRED